MSHNDRSEVLLKAAERLVCARRDLVDAETEWRSLWGPSADGRSADVELEELRSRLATVTRERDEALADLHTAVDLVAALQGADSKAIP